MNVAYDYLRLNIPQKAIGIHDVKMGNSSYNTLKYNSKT